MPAAKERGDRGRGTSAFEMVLSPGAGIASAARGQAHLPPAGYPSGRNSQCRLGSVAGDARGETPLPTTPLSKTPPVFHTVWKRLWTFPRLFHSLWKTMLKSTVCIAVCNPRRPRIRALQQKNTPPAVLWICIKNRTDKFPKPTASPTGCPQMPVDRTPGFPTENRKNPSTTTGLSRSERRRTPKNPQKTTPGRGFPQSVKVKSGYSAQNRADKNAKKFLPWLDIPVFHSSPPPTAPASGWKDRRMDGSRAGAREAESGQTLTERAGRHFPLSHYIY